MVPVTINGTYGILKKGALGIRPGTVTMVLDAPVDPPQAEGRAAEMLLMEKVHRVIESHYANQ